jgi:hypothetical protein
VIAVAESILISLATSPSWAKGDVPQVINTNSNAIIMKMLITAILDFRDRVSGHGDIQAGTKKGKHDDTKDAMFVYNSDKIAEITNSFATSINEQYADFRTQLQIVIDSAIKLNNQLGNTVTGIGALRKRCVITTLL